MNTAIQSAVDRKPLAKPQERTVLSGIVTGQIAGLIMAVVVMAVFTIFLGKGPLYPVQVIGSALLGESALSGFNVTAVLAGLVLHQLGPSLLWGVVFGLIATKVEVRRTGEALALGLVIGIVSMVGPYLLIPFLMTTLHGVDIWNREVPMAWDWAAHLVFGASFALYPRIRIVPKLPLRQPEI
jgi:MFS family permease